MTTDEPTDIRPALTTATKRIGGAMGSSLTDEQRALLKARREAQEAEEARQNSPAARFGRIVGSRYANCTLENFETDGNADKEAAVKAAGLIVASLDSALVQSVVFAGTVGTGKDHLLAACLREAMRRRAEFKFTNGADLAGRCRDLIGSDGYEREFLSEWARIPILAISDPDGSREKQSEFYLEWLYRIIDARYRANLPTWMTINAKDGDEACKLIGDRCWDRVRDGAVVVRMCWPSYRAAETVIGRKS